MPDRSRDQTAVVWALETTQDTGQEKREQRGLREHRKRHPVWPSGEGQEMDTHEQSQKGRSELANQNQKGRSTH